MLLMIPLACRLGLRAEVAAQICALTVHEATHLVAAACMRVSIPHLRLMPFGGSASIGNPYTLTPLQLGTVAAAGPASNLLLILLSTSMAHWGLLAPPDALLFLRVNLVLLAFNLLPALPLDGGRMLYAALFRRIGADKALTIGIWAGRVAAAGLMLSAAALFVRQGVLNLSYLFAAVFLIASGPQERAALSRSNIHALVAALSPVSAPAPVYLTAVDGACSALNALRHARPDAVNLYAVYSDGALTGFSDDRALIDLCMSGSADTPVARARLYKVLSTQKSPSAVSQ